MGLMMGALSSAVDWRGLPSSCGSPSQPHWSRVLRFQLLWVVPVPALPGGALIQSHTFAPDLCLSMAGLFFSCFLLDRLFPHGFRTATSFCFLNHWPSLSHVAMYNEPPWPEERKTLISPAQSHRNSEWGGEECFQKENLKVEENGSGKQN